MLNSSHPAWQALSASASLSYAGTSTRIAASWTLPFIVSAIKPPSVARTPFVPPRTYLWRHGKKATLLGDWRGRGIE
jgi:hypothetical protein